MNWLMGWLFLCYPLLAHLATLWHSQTLAALALLALVSVPLLPALRRLRPMAWLWWLASAAAVLLLARSGWASVLALLPPVLIPLAVMATFAESLRPGREPLVTRMATLVRGGPLPAELIGYTRRVTMAWVILLALLALSALLLAIFAPREIWSLATNAGMYLVMGLMFVGEYLYRRWRYRHLSHESFAGFIAGMARNRPQAGRSGQG